MNARLIAATNRDLLKEVEAGRFRNDLFYRINVMTITVPPLRERREDLTILTRGILSQLHAELRFYAPLRIDAAAIKLLKNYNWPGNVRELRNVLERAAILFKRWGHRPCRSSTAHESERSKSGVVIYNLVPVRGHAPRCDR